MATRRLKHNESPTMSRYQQNSPARSGAFRQRNRNLKAKSTLRNQLESQITFKDDVRKFPGSPFRYRTKGDQPFFDVNQARKQAGDGRINKTFKDKTPRLRDPEIKDLLLKYPTQPTSDKGSEGSDKESETSLQKSKPPKFDKNSIDPVYIAVNAPVKQGRVKLIRKAIDTITRNIDMMDIKSKEEYKEMITRWVKMDLREKEIKKIADVLKDIDYAEPDQLGALYEYRTNDFNEKIKIAVDVAREYKEGKLDPQKFESKTKKRKS